ncbi:CobW family GTP-binding protein [Piscinibacter sp.]|uniref:CobW family GTP-binding protein n=1 Tax=Piscinibacter sp. TaxID=1903157 RepID=UPI002BF670A2|nr:GTP-binding protein [Albitalea sp.]HUG21068.1 GTP-binding protein [Albitalea sp.]
MIPVTVLTGFLGSGKTTVLNCLLSRPELADTAVIINEFGPVGIDHLLVDHVAENMRLLASGCLCCTVRGDLIETLGTLADRRARGEIRFDRVIVETTGLADPAPVLHTLMADPAVAPHFRLDGVVTTVDAVNGAGTLQRHAEAVKQVGVADALLLTKTDLASASDADALAAQLARLNPGARIRRVVDGAVDPEHVLGVGWFDPAGSTVREFAFHGEAEHDHGHDHGHHHDSHVKAHAFAFDAPLPEAAFTHWLELMAAMRGERLLRVKGLVQLAERPDEPLVVHGVQHVFHPPQRLAAWPSADHRSRLVFIVRDIARDEIERTFHKFVQPTEESTA